MNNEKEMNVQENKVSEHSAKTAVIAFIMFVLGYLISNWVAFCEGTQGLGTFTIVLIMTALSLIYMKIGKIKLTKKKIIQLVIIVCFTVPLILISDAFIKFLIISYFHLSFVYWFFCACDNREENEIGDMFFFDIIKSTILLPFSCFGAIFVSLVKFAKESSIGKKMILVGIGIAVSVIPTTIVTFLLISADGAFGNLAEKLLEDSIWDIPKNIFFFLFGIPIAMYIFGMMYANINHKRKNIMTKKDCQKASAFVRFLPTVMICTAITPIIIVYLLFFFSQTSYFLSAFSGIRPEHITFAEYARRGFFELCAVSIINMIIMIIASIFTKRDNEKRSPVVKGYVVTLSFFTLALIAIALSKMFMYIDAYGLTLLRVYTTWFMVLLALIFVFVLTKQICSKFNLAKTLVVSFAIMFALLIFSDADAIVAKYNVHCYKTGKFDTVDIQMMYDLSDSAVKYVIPLAEDENTYVATRARRYLEYKKDYYSYLRENTYANFNFSTYNAQKALEEYYSKIENQ